ncbi:hypothetical protein [Aestuariivirga sp.]|uniref:hypothetical protein n=1 Tax=Aestuariivirga sp. TaxID=2650926 RepID=UPI0039E27898
MKPQSTREYAWLVEGCVQEVSPHFARVQLYFSGFKLTFETQTPRVRSYEPTWTTDVEKAVRFCRKQDAEVTARELDKTRSPQAVEHCWFIPILEEPKP